MQSRADRSQMRKEELSASEYTAQVADTSATVVYGTVDRIRLMPTSRRFPCFAYSRLVY